MISDAKQLNEKIQKYFSESYVLKTKENRSIFQGFNVPSFVKDWLIKKFSDETGKLDSQGLFDFLENHIPQKNDKIKGRLISERKDIKVLSRIEIEPDVKSGELKFAIPDLDIKSNEGKIPPYIAKFNKDLVGGELWGVVSLSYQQPEGKKKNGYIQLDKYQPFRPYTVELKYYQDAREQFSLDEWIDLMIRSMEYNPEGFESTNQKINFISRLCLFVEPRINFIELAPKETGKTYVFGNLSKYGWIVSGGFLTRAKMFYDLNRNLPGYIVTHDFVAIDEIANISSTDQNQIVGALKSYLESGSFTVGDVKKIADAGLILLGNIELDQDLKPKEKRYIRYLPSFMQDSALIDRFHGFIEGWNLPKINEDLIINNFSLNVEYFSEILHLLRSDIHYSAIVNQLLDVPPKADTRDMNAIRRIATAYMKLLFPHIKNSKEITLDEFDTYCLKPAIEKRRLIRSQLCLIDEEYSADLPDVKVKGI